MNIDRKNIILRFTFAEGVASIEYLDPMLLASELKRIESGTKELYGLAPTSLLWKVLYSIKDNNTFNLLDRTNDGGQHGTRDFRNTARGNEGSRSIIRIDKKDDPRRKHPRNIRSRYSPMSTRR